MQSPYADLDPRAYWRTAVGSREPLDPGDLYRPKFKIDRSMRIVTAGSCFAQHIGRTLGAAGFNIVDAEPFPARLSPEVAQRFGYGVYSARYGNIYTSAQLLQLIREARGQFEPALPVWERNGRFYDAQRPAVEPDGLPSEELVLKHRALHLAKVRAMIRNCDLLVFTFGLTEAWRHRESGTVYPTAPGTIAGTYDPEVFEFVNFGFADVITDFRKAIGVLRQLNPGMKVLITTSPVPLTATASGEHVEVATCYSKSVLRAVCGQLCQALDFVDYYPSYEIITSVNSRGVYYASNKRSISSLGVQTAMRLFMQAHSAGQPGPADAPANTSDTAPPSGETDDVMCEEALLEAFAK